MEKVKNKVPLGVYSFSEGDTKEAADLHHLCFEDSWSEQFFRNLLLTPCVQGFLIKSQQSKTLHGFILGQLCVDMAEIYTLVVHPKYRREKVATHLMESFLCECLKQSIEKIFIEVNENNKSALNFYQKLEFRKYGLRENYYTLPHNNYANAVLMRLKINKK